MIDNTEGHSNVAIGYLAAHNLTTGDYNVAIGHDALAAAKAGIIGLTLSSAASYAARNIRVNCVAPGLIDTPLTSKLTSNKTSLEVSNKMHPLGRIGNAEDVASAIVWLLDPKNSWLTGQVIGVDGGLGSMLPKLSR